eukprot:CAMPEP_0168323068 /NCGR_PEP_ID=MMETSP0213-20121227/3273_1 /TAXON_ID=151035 /ORGANISM="Euplotes harpa, Strain FSP1.4" /LENGTH=84 /DNA_ID=CAMNT_0008325093 /DNA_START=660 /DNA_END=911 /DNA_ORIENTATION=+
MSKEINIEMFLARPNISMHPFGYPARVVPAAAAAAKESEYGIDEQCEDVPHHMEDELPLSIYLLPNSFQSKQEDKSQFLVISSP